MAIMPVKKGYMIREDTGERLEFQYNPTFLDDEKTAEYENTNVPGANFPHSEFAGGGDWKFKFSLRFIANGMKYDTSKAVVWLRQLPYAVKHPDGTVAPPKVLLAIGGLIIRCKVTKVTVHYLRWAPTLRPIDLQVDLEMKHWPNVMPPKPAPPSKAKPKAVPVVEKITVQKQSTRSPYLDRLRQ